ncbi:MAG: hypothetical protein AAB731_02485, partial [Patescibacteria group bacterium]
MPYMNWGNPQNLTNFINHIAARDSVSGGSFAFLNGKFFENVFNWINLTYLQFFITGSVFLIIGLGA